MRVRRVLPFVGCCLLVAAAALAVSEPVAVSPGDTSKLVLIADACPTFSWGHVDQAESFELVVYRLGEEGEEAVPVVRQQFAGSAFSWTPSLARCVERGRSYAWTVRAHGLEESSSWSPPRLFQVAAGPSRAELEAALAVVQRYLETEHNTGAASGEVTEARAELEPEASAESPVPSAAPAGTQLSVGGNVDAASFSGSGALLTSLDPTKLLAGVAGIDITGAAAAVSGVVPISHGGTGATNSGDACTNLGAALAADLAAHESEAFVHHPDLPIGTIVMWAGVVVPDGWALCDGETVLDRNGDLLVTPDLRGRFVVGADAGHGLGSAGGVATHNHYQYHTHHFSDTTDASSDRDGTKNEDSNSFADSDHTHSFEGNTGGPQSPYSYTQSSSNEPPWHGLNFIIKK